MNRRVAALLTIAAAATTAWIVSCVGDSSTVPDGGGDATSTDGGPEAAVDAGCKTCGSSCVSVDDPNYGCTATSCTPCPARAHVTTQACSSGACVIAACDPAYDDLNGDAGDGCETPNPRAFHPDKLALWLKADQGVSLEADGGVQTWSSQSDAGSAIEGGVDAGAGIATHAAGTITVDKTLWPTLPGATSLAFQSASMDVDLSGMSSANGFTLFLVEARYGDTGDCVLGSHTNPLPVNCCTDQAAAFQLCDSNTTRGFEPYCDPFTTSMPANTSAGYQANLTQVWFDPTLPRYYLSLNAGTPADNSATFCPGAGPLTNLNVPGRIGGGYGYASYNGLVGEIVLYSMLLSSPDKTAVLSYLKTKWHTP